MVGGGVVDEWVTREGRRPAVRAGASVDSASLGFWCQILKEDRSYPCLPIGPPHPQGPEAGSGLETTNLTLVPPLQEPALGTGARVILSGGTFGEAREGRGHAYGDRRREGGKEGERLRGMDSWSE
jgi:hypothetical protein